MYLSKSKMFYFVGQGVVDKMYLFKSGVIFRSGGRGESNSPNLKCFIFWVGSKCISSTRMHSSRMRTVRSSRRLSGGVCFWGVSARGVYSGGCLLWGGAYSGGCLLLGGPLRGVSAPGGRVGGSALGDGIPACTEADTPPHVDRHTPVKT